MDNEMIVTNNEEPTELMAPSDMNGLAFLNPGDMPNLEEAEVGFSVSPKYYEFITPGEIVRAVFNGMTTIVSTKNGDRRDIDAAVFQNKDGVWLNSGANLVGQIRNLHPGAAIQITYTGKERTKSGNEVKIFDVRTLNVKAHVTPAPASQPVKNEAEQPVIKDYITAFWTKCQELGLTNIEGQAILKEAGGSFTKAYDALNG